MEGLDVMHWIQMICGTSDLRQKSMYQFSVLISRLTYYLPLLITISYLNHMYQIKLITKIPSIMVIKDCHNIFMFLLSSI